MSETRMTLESVVIGRIEQPHRVALYGQPGVGKTTWAADAPAPIFIGAEKGTAELDVARFPQPQTWSEVGEALRTLHAAEHSYQTVVIDTLDWLEPLAHADVVATYNAGASHPVDGIDGIGYGRGYNLALDMWRVFLRRLERLCEDRKMHVILLAHSHVKQHKSPDQEPFDRYSMKLHHKATGLILEWASDVLFAQHETFTHQENKMAPIKGISSGARIVHTEWAAAWDAKNRHGLPARLPLSWEAFDAAVTAGTPADPAELEAAILAGLESVADAEYVKKATAAVKTAKNDAAKLAKILNKVTATIGEKND